MRLIQSSITASGIAISPTTSMHRIFPLSMPWLFTGNAGELKMPMPLSNACSV
ncbi:MAG: hypothetical protein U0175_02910 [Caldilineaceae bacterium]